MVGQTIGQYRIVEKLGEGGMGTVYRADDLKLDRTVALKFVLSSLGDGLGGQERLMREAKACASLNHPNITIVHDFGEHDSRSFIVMEFVEGTTLQDAIRERSFSAEDTVSIGLQIADALGAAHEKGIIHRDLKSANVMLDSGERVKVMDFGLAKLAEGSFLTQTGTTLGTAAYMSPEQVRGGDLTNRSDIYSLGVVLYELDTGVTPYPHAHQLAVMYAVANEKPTPPRERNPEVPEALQAVILKAMAKDPAERFGTCHELAAALRELRQASAPAKPSVPRFQAPLVQKRWFRVGVPMVLVAALTATALVMNGPALVTSSTAQLSKWVGGDSTRTQAYYDAGMSYFHQGDFAEAQAQLERAVEIHPTSAQAWSALAAVSVNTGSYVAAIIQSETAVRLDPEDEEAHYNLAYASEETGEYARARAAYADAIRLDSSFIAAYSALGNLLIERGEPEKAPAVLKQALDRAPDHEHIYLIHKNLGKAYLAQERYDEAAKHLRRSLELEPNWAETTSLLAQTYDALGRPEDARPLWQRYLELETDAAKLTAARERLAAE